jgi:single-stranded-DNA-specific exonuclease
MKRLQSGACRAGIKALLEVAAKNPATLTFRDLGFTIGPRINAAGRMESGLRAVELLRSIKAEAHRELAQRIQQFNTERREVQKEMFDQAKELIDVEGFPFSNVLYQPDWHKGVVGIVASKVVETRYRPTIVLTKSGDTLAGSARSVTDFDLYEALTACEEHLIQFGGHKYAAGMTLHESQLPHFKKAFELYCQKNLRPEQLEQNLNYDAPAHLSQFTSRFYDILKQLDPHGPENPAPVFLLKNLVNAGFTKAVGGGEHLKVHLKQQDGGPAISGIAFGQGNEAKAFKDGAAFDVLASLTENHFRGETSIELMVVSMKPSS